jgi:DNA-binding NarL/FixJ family response regulator
MTRILLVDDHAIALSGLRSTIGGAVPGAEFGEASTAPQALSLLEQGTWDLLVLDLGLPPPGGLELLRTLHRERPTLRVLVVSAFAEEEFAVVCLRQGAAGYVAKTSGAAELRAAAVKVLSGGKYVSPLLAEVLASAVSAPATEPSHQALSSRELQVLRAVAAGKSSKEIAADLQVAERTIGTYRARITGKLGLKTAVEITRYAMKAGLVE